MGGMKIGIDASSLIAQKTGIGSFASHLLDTFAHSPRGIDFVQLKPVSVADMNTPKRLFWEAFTLPQMAQKAKVDALYSPGFSPPPAGRFKRIVTVHDVIGLIFPQNVGLASRFYWTHWLPQNLKKAHKLVASSECTKRDMVRLLKLPSERIDVVPLAVRETFRVPEDLSAVKRARDKYGLPNRYLMSVSSLEPRKNHLRLLRVFDRVRQNNPDLSLVIIGKPAGAESGLAQFIAEKNMQNSVKLLGYVPEEDVISLYGGALGYVIISHYEGFGLPALEAMNCGLTGVVADNSSMPEVTGDTAFLVPPEDEEAIEQALRTLIGDEALRQKMSGAALARSQQFSIQKTALRMQEIFKKECSS